MDDKKNTTKGKAKDIDIIIGENIKNIRIYRNISQSEMARLLNVSFQQVQKYENGTNRVSASSLYILSKELNIPIKLFFERIDEEFMPHQKITSLSPEELKLLSLWNVLQSDSIKTSIIAILKSSVDASIKSNSVM